jgi:nucleoside 2-deoxyribosyltransferase
VTSIYLAASVFSIFERESNARVAHALEKEGYEVFLPQTTAPPETESGLDMKYIYEECKNRLDTSDLVVAIVDGADVDSGVAWELGYAFAKKTPAICIRTDMRKAEDKGVNIMIEYGSTKTVYQTHYHQNVEEVIKNIVLEIKELVG